MEIPMVFKLGNIIIASQKLRHSTTWQATFHTY